MDLGAVSTNGRAHTAVNTGLNAPDVSQTMLLPYQDLCVRNTSCMEQNHANHYSAAGRGRT